MDASEEIKFHVKIADMESEIQQDIVDIAVEVMRNNDTETLIAQGVKKRLDDQFGPTWHVIVGRSFGSYVTHESGKFLYFYVGKLAFLVFKSGSLGLATPRYCLVTTQNHTIGLTVMVNYSTLINYYLSLLWQLPITIVTMAATVRGKPSADDLVMNMNLYKSSKIMQILRECVSIAFEQGDLLTPAHFEKVDMLHYFGCDSLLEFCHRFSLDSESVVIDVGAGVGGPARFIAHHLGCHVHAMEYVGDLVRAGKVLNRLQNLDRFVHFHEGDFTAISLSEIGLVDTADALVSQLCFLHIPNKKELFGQIARSLKPSSGVLYIEDFFLRDGCVFSDHERSLLSQRISVCDIDSCILSKSQYIAHIEASGMKVVEWVDKTDAWSSFVWERYNQFIESYIKPPSQDGTAPQSPSLHLHRQQQLRSSYDSHAISEMDEFYRSMAELYRSFGEDVDHMRLNEKFPYAYQHIMEFSTNTDHILEPQRLGGVIIIAKML